MPWALSTEWLYVVEVTHADHPIDTPADALIDVGVDALPQSAAARAECHHTGRVRAGWRPARHHRRVAASEQLGHLRQAYGPDAQRQSAGLAHRPGRLRLGSRDEHQDGRP